MKDRKKPKRKKARVQTHKKRSTFTGHAIIVVILVGIIAVSIFFLYSMLYSPSEQNPINPDSKLKAAIVDQLSLTVPNQTFIQTATNILETANYTVDYYPGENVTVEFYRNLPAHGYGIIILRVHSALSIKEGSENLALFTSELYSKTEHVWDQLFDRVVQVRYTEGTEWYFGISPEFIKSGMNGRFQDTTIIMMGCYGLTFNKTAEAFIEQGAKAYLSWNWTVSASHTDLATTYLLQHLITEKQTIRQAVTETMKEVGPDPADNSILRYYPLEAGDYITQNVEED